MAWWEREYWRAGEESPFLSRRSPLAITLTTLHVAAFAALLAGPSDWTAREGVPFGLVAGYAPPYAIFTHILASARLGDLLLVLVAIWSLGRLVETQTNWVQALAQYLFGSVVGAGLYWSVARLQPEFSHVALVAPIGGLAAWCLGAWSVLGERRVILIRWEVAQRAVVVVAALFVIVVTVAGKGVGAAAWLAAVAGGGLAQALLVAIFAALERRRSTRPRRPLARIAPLRSSASSVAGSAAASAPPESAPGADVRRRIDELLAKIARHGIDSLSPEERTQLEAMRRELMQR